MSEIENLFNERRAQPSDIWQHMERLKALAIGCIRVAEFGVRSGNSTVSLLAGLDVYGGELFSYDINPAGLQIPTMERAAWTFTQANTAELTEIPECDGLFIDTLHTAAQVAAELKHAHRVADWIAFHDTVLFGTRDEDTGAEIGICHPIWEFLAANHEWRPAAHYPENCGLLVLRRSRV